MVVLIDAQGQYCGLVQTAEAFAAELDHVASRRSVHSLAHWREAVLTPDMDIKAAMSLFDQAEAETLAVVSGAGQAKVVGLLTEAYASRRYAEELDKAHRSLSGEDA